MSNLKRIRQSLGMSQSKLAETSGVSVRMIQHYEQGVKDINKAQVLTVYQLATALNCTIEELLDGVEKSLGEWISIGNWLLTCSVCDDIIEDNDTGEYPKYCKNCGKKMKPIKKEVEE